MTKESKKKEGRPKGSEFKKFIRKRAPIYLGVIALIIVFVVPELTKGDLQSKFPENMTEKERQVLQTLMSYKGSNEKGLSVYDAISNKISEEYPNERIYDNKKTSVDILINSNQSDYQVILDFKSHKGGFSYDWNINMDSGNIKGNNPESKHIIDLVDFYD